tara:strand:- start:557 stop:691 length:135 start_codon:yes stop_codon:yes gene_type:complete
MLKSKVKSKVKKKAKRVVTGAFVMFCAALVFGLGCFAEKNVERY